MKSVLLLLPLLFSLVLPLQSSAVDYKTDIAPAFEARCVWCHSVGGHQAGGLYLETEHAVENLVSVPSSQKDGFLRVAPGDPENSYLIKKLRGDFDVVGARMPPGFYPPLEKDIMDKIKQWILELPEQTK